MRFHPPSPSLNPRSGGFTILELVIVMVIMALLMGLAVVNFDGVDAERDLRRPASELQRMTMEAVRRSGLWERPQVIVFDSKGFSMRYRNDANGRSEKSDKAVWHRRVDIAPEVKLTLRRFGTQKFAPAAGQRISIAPGGLCEPLTARFEKGASWLEITLDPLSGSVSEQAMYIP